MKIILETEEELQIKDMIYESLRPISSNIIIKNPLDSFACVIWSIDDLRSFMPNISDKELFRLMTNLERGLKDYTIQCGWDYIQNSIQEETK